MNNYFLQNKTCFKGNVMVSQDEMTVTYVLPMDGNFTYHVMDGCLMPTAVSMGTTVDSGDAERLIYIELDKCGEESGFFNVECYPGKHPTRRSAMSIRYHIWDSFRRVSCDGNSSFELNIS